MLHRFLERYELGQVVTDADVHQAYAEKVNFLLSDTDRGLERGVAPERVEHPANIAPDGVVHHDCDGLPARVVQR